MIFCLDATDYIMVTSDADLLDTDNPQFYDRKQTLCVRHAQDADHTHSPDSPPGLVLFLDESSAKIATQTDKFRIIK